MLDQPTITRRFYLRNESNDPVAISRMATACSCTTIRLAFPNLPPQLQASMQIMPGQAVPVEVAVDVSRKWQGAFVESASIYTKKRDAPSLNFIVSGTIKPIATFSPPIVDFGDTRRRAPSSAMVSVDIDGRLVREGSPLELSSTDADLLIEPQPEISKVPEAHNQARRGPSVRHFRYRISISPSHASGPIAATLSFKGGETILARATALVTGKVNGDVEATPPSINFIARGRDATTQVVLKGVAENTLQGAHVAAADTWLEAAIDPSIPVFANGSRQTSSAVLVIKLAQGTTIRSGHSAIKVTLATGERLIVPVTVSSLTE
jgi:hypothetical protein